MVYEAISAEPRYERRLNPLGGTSVAGEGGQNEVIAHGVRHGTGSTIDTIAAEAQRLAMMRPIEATPTSGPSGPPMTSPTATSPSGSRLDNDGEDPAPRIALGGPRPPTGMGFG